MKPLYLVIGLSGSGKDTLVDKMLYIFPEKKKLMSMTTREKRLDEKASHIYVTETMFHTLEPNLVAKTKYAGHWYGATAEQVENADFYIIDMDGLHYLKKHLKTDRPIYTVAIIAPEHLRKERIIKRDGEEKALKRLASETTAKKAILNYKDKFDLVIVNKDFLDATTTFKDFIISKEK